MSDTFPHADERTELPAIRPAQLRLVLDDVQPLLPQPRQAIQHPLQDLRVVTLPAVHLRDVAPELAGAVGLRGVAGEPLVYQVSARTFRVAGPG